MDWRIGYTEYKLLEIVYSWCGVLWGVTKRQILFLVNCHDFRAIILGSVLQQITILRHNGKGECQG